MATVKGFNHNKPCDDLHATVKDIRFPQSIVVVF